MDQLTFASKMIEAWLTFIPKTIEALAWPSAAAFIAWKFREPIGLLMHRITALEVAGVKAELQHDFASAEESARQVAEPSMPIEATGASTQAPNVSSAEGSVTDAPASPEASLAAAASEASIALANIPADPAADVANPAGSIMEAWSAVVSAARSRLALENKKIPGSLSADSIARMHDNELFGALAVQNIVSPKQLELFADLRAIRNKAARSSPSIVSPEDVARFRSMAQTLLNSLVRTRERRRN